MPKVRIYKPSELMEMTKGDVLKIVQREAERVNKQITRYKARGAVAGDVIPTTALTRIKMASLKTMKKRQLVHAYNQMQDRTVSGLTVKGVEKARDVRTQVAKELNVSPDIIHADDLHKLHKVLEQAKTDNAAFYEVLVKVVELGIEDDTQFFRTTSDEMTELTKDEEGRAIFMDQQIERINKAIRSKNQQARDKGETDLRKLKKEYSMEKAHARALNKAKTKIRATHKELRKKGYKDYRI